VPLMLALGTLLVLEEWARANSGCGHHIWKDPRRRPPNGSFWDSSSPLPHLSATNSQRPTAVGVVVIVVAIVIVVAVVVAVVVGFLKPSRFLHLWVFRIFGFVFELSTFQALLHCSGS